MFIKEHKLAVVATTVTLFALALALALDAGLAKAGTLMFKDDNKLEWKASWDDTQNGVTVNFGFFPDKKTFDDPNKNSAGRTDSSIGTFIKTATFPKDEFGPIKITFTQMDQGKADDFGLRFTMNEVVTNNTGKNWVSFKEELKDTKDIPQTDKDKNPGGAHPFFAHFHSDKAFTSKDGTLMYPGFNGDQFKDPKSLPGNPSAKLFEFTNGPVPNGADWKPTGIGIHERTYADTTRVFDLIETPVAASLPEPPGLILMVISVAAMLGSAWRRRKSTTP